MLTINWQNDKTLVNVSLKKRGKIMDYREMYLTDLRRYAKSIGVKCPTKYKKAVLIKKIKEVQNGEREPEYSTKGRPVKIMIEQLEVTKVDILLYAIKRGKTFLEELEREIEQKIKKDEKK